MKNIGFQVLILDLFLLNRSDEVVSKKLSCDVHSLFDQLSKSVHAVTAPFTFVETAFAPLVHSQSLSLVFTENSIISVPWGPFVETVTVLLSIQKLPFVDLSDLKDQLSSTVLHILSPLAVVYITILILVSSLETHVVSESANEDISVE